MKAVTCGGIVYDGDHNPYPTVEVAGYCWTQKNLRAKHYADGITPIATAMVYASAAHSDATANEETYGRLYSWFSAVNVLEGSTEAPVSDADGYVQGICPDGWHIPTETEMAALKGISSHDLNATTLWQGAAASSYTNSTGFTALPAGLYNAFLDRFEGLGTQTDWWSVTNTGGSGTDITTAHTCCSAYYCDHLIDRQHLPTNTLSVRCVKND